MDWKLFAQLAATLAVGLLGGWLGHRLSSRRDFVNERRKLRISYLMEAYRKLESASNREDLKPYLLNFESALADIQLLGSVHQVRLARLFAIRMAKNRGTALDELIFDLRQSLRAELGLASVTESIIYPRMQDAP